MNTVFGVTTNASLKFMIIYFHPEIDITWYLSLKDSIFDLILINLNFSICNYRFSFIVVDKISVPDDFFII